MSSFALEASARPSGITPAALRRDRRVPAVFYGKGLATIHLVLPAKIFTSLYRKAGETNLVDLKLDNGKTFKALIHDVQLHPVTDEVVHVDLINVNMSEKLTTRIPVKVKGISLAVKDLAGVLSILSHELEIRCLPSDLIHEVEIDISHLATLHSSVHVRDLKLPSTIEILTDPSRTLVTVLAPKKEEEVTAAATAVPVEGAAPAEGEAAAAETAPVVADGGGGKEKKEGGREAKKPKKT